MNSRQCNHYSRVSAHVFNAFDIFGKAFIALPCSPSAQQQMDRALLGLDLRHICSCGGMDDVWTSHGLTMCVPCSLKKQVVTPRLQHIKLYAE